MNRNKVFTKAPKKPYVSSKTSDRRQAAGSSVYLQRQKQQASQIPPEVINQLKSSSGPSNSKAVLRHDPKTGKTWYDATLTDWDPSHYRLFVGNVGDDVTEELLIQTFMKYKSLSKVKIPKEEGKDGNKGYAFLSFAEAKDYLHCYKEMNGKYVGSKPITLERAKTEIGDVVKVNKSSIKRTSIKKRY